MGALRHSALAFLLTAGALGAQSPPLVLPADVRGACAAFERDTVSFQRFLPFCRLEVSQLSGSVIPSPDTVIRYARCGDGPCPAADSLAALRGALTSLSRLAALPPDSFQVEFRRRAADLKSRLSAARAAGGRAGAQVQGWADLYALVIVARFRPSPEVFQFIKDYAVLLGRLADTSVATLRVEVEAAMPVTTTAARTVGESDLLWGLTDFLIDRASAELQAFYLERASRLVCGDALQASLLPRTCTELARIGDRGLLPPALVRAALRADLGRLPARLLDLAPSDPNARAAAAMLRLVEAALARQEDALRGVAELWVTVNPRDLDAQPVRLALYRLSVLADLTQRLSAERWNEWRGIAQAAAVNVAWGAVPEWGPRPEGVGGWPFDPRALDAAIAVLRATPSGAGSREALRAYVARVVEAARLMAPVDVHRQLDQARVPVAYALQAAEAAASADYVGGAVVTMRMVESVGLAGDTVPLPFLLLAEVAQAGDAAGVTAAMHRFANAMTTAPPKRSRAARAVFGVNAYLGVLGGAERNALATGTSRERFFGAFAPLGIELSPLFGLGPLAPGLFVHFLDVGALASYRLSDKDGVSENPEVTLRQVFALGGYVTFAIRGSPLSFGFGVSNAPRLRTIDVGGVEERVGARRFGVFLGVDVPVWRR